MSDPFCKFGPQIGIQNGVQIGVQLDLKKSKKKNFSRKKIFLPIFFYQIYRKTGPNLVFKFFFYTGRTAEIVFGILDFFDFFIDFQDEILARITKFTPKNFRSQKFFFFENRIELLCTVLDFQKRLQIFRSKFGRKSVFKKKISVFLSRGVCFKNIPQIVKIGMM